MYYTLLMARKSKKLQSKRAVKKVLKKSIQKSNNNFLLILLAACGLLALGTVFYTNKISKDSSPPVSESQKIGWKTFENDKYYFRFPAGMTSQVVLTEKAKDGYLTPTGFTKIETKKVEVDGKVLDEIFFQSKTNDELYVIRLILNSSDYLTYSERENVEGRALLTDILSTFKFKD